MIKPPRRLSTTSVVTTPRPQQDLRGRRGGDSAFPGAFAVVGTRAGVVASYGAGRLDWKPSAVPDERSLWDMASLTKVVGTTTAAMLLEEEGRLVLDSAVRAYLPAFDVPDKRAITVRMLLEHSSGMGAFHPLYREAKGREAKRRE